MRAVWRFLRPSLPKAIFTFHWLAYLLLCLITGRAGDGHWWLRAGWPLLALYLWGCVATAWSRRTHRLAHGWRLAGVVIALVLLDQAGKAVAAQLPPGTSWPVIGDWLMLTHAPNRAGSLLLPAWAKPGLVGLVILALPLGALGYGYYSTMQRRSPWVDLAYIGVTAGAASWLTDIVLRGYVLDFVSIPQVVAFDFKDVYLSLALAVVIAVLDVSGAAAFRWRGWRTEAIAMRRLLTDIAAYARRTLRHG